MFLFVGIPILSFGTGKIELYFADTTRIIFVILMFCYNLFAVTVLENEGRGSGEGTDTVHSQKIANKILQISTILIVIVAPFSLGHNFAVLPESFLLKYVALAFILVGDYLMLISVYILGKQFSLEITIQSEHKLVQTSLYSVIRHPRYLGIILLFAGISLLFLSIIGLVLTFAIFFVLIKRIKVEEALMEKQFNEEWNDYTKRTKKLFPYIY